MKMITLMIAALPLLCAGQSHPSGPCSVSKDKPVIAADGTVWGCMPRWPFVASVAFLASSQAADILSSRGQYELNPILGRGPFGTRQETIKAGAVAAVLLTEWSLRKHPALRRGFTWMNYVVGGVTFGVAAHNLKER